MDIIALEITALDSLLMICADENVLQYYPIVADMSVNYKE